MRLLITLLLFISLLNSLQAKGLAEYLYGYHEKEALNQGWKRLSFPLGGTTRKLLWRAPSGSWSKGAIVALHGGGGDSANWASTVKIGRAKVAFSKEAFKRGFAVFSLNSTDGLAKDAKGRSFGKRWDCTFQPKVKNVDLPYIEKVLDEIIPKVRPEGSNENIYMTGISNGGFMTILAVTHFPKKVRAFAPVACGDPYGTYMDMGTKPFLERRKAPGVFRDLETNEKVNSKGAAYAPSYPSEHPWPKRKSKKPPFKQFHHQQDGLCDYSCMVKARKQLRLNGYPDDGPYVAKTKGRRALRHHFWQPEYNKPLLDFFERCR